MRGGRGAAGGWSGRPAAAPNGRPPPRRAAAGWRPAAPRSRRPGRARRAAATRYSRRPCRCWRAMPNSACSPRWNPVVAASIARAAAVGYAVPNALTKSHTYHARTPRPRSARPCAPPAARRPLPDPDTGGPNRAADADRLSGHRRSPRVAARLGAVVGEEQLLQRRFAAEQLGDPDRGQHASAAARPGRDLAAHPVAVAPRRRARRAPATGPAARLSNVASTDSDERWRSSASVPISTSRPPRRIATRSHSASTSLRMCDDKNTVWPAARGLGDAVRGTPAPSAGRGRWSARRARSRSARRPERRDQDQLLPVALRVRRAPSWTGRARTARSARPGTPHRPGPAPGPAGAASPRR